MLFSQNLACPDCGISIEELTPRSFSFNSPFGACPTCAGLGVQMKIDPDLIVPDWTKSLRENPFAVMGWSNLDPVSYTHLDVYKRQVVNGNPIRTGITCPNAVINALLPVLPARHHMGPQPRAQEHGAHLLHLRFARDHDDAAVKQTRARKSAHRVHDHRLPAQRAEHLVARHAHARAAARGHNHRGIHPR